MREKRKKEKKKKKKKNLHSTTAVDKGGTQLSELYIIEQVPSKK